jgi:hypothetical protein
MSDRLKQIVETAHQVRSIDVGVWQKTPPPTDNVVIAKADLAWMVENLQRLEVRATPEPETTTEYRILFEHEGELIIEPIGAGMAEGYQRQDWCTVFSRTCTEWTEWTEVTR